MFQALIAKPRAWFWHAVRNVFVLGGVLLVGLALSAIVLPFVLGLMLLVAAHHAARRGEPETTAEVVPSGAT